MGSSFRALCRSCGPSSIIPLILACFANSPMLAQSTSDPQQLLKEAVELHQAGKLDDAIRDYRLLLDRYPNIAAVHSDLGAALAGQGRYGEAIEEYKKALALQPLPQVRLNLGLAYYKAGRLRLAIEAFEKVHAEVPGDSKPVLLQADCHLRLGENKKVIELLTPQEEKDPDNLALTYMLGTALVRDNRAEKGQLLINKIMGKGDSAEARMLVGTTKLMLNDFSGALTDLQKAVELNPELPDAYAYYGAALVASGDQEGAKDAFGKALTQDPNNFDANLRMGFLLRNDDKYEEALGYLRHALEIRPGDFGVRYQIGAVELSMGRLPEAQSDLESLVKEAPNFTEAHVSLATLYYREKKKEEGDRERAIVDKLTAQSRQQTEGKVNQ